MPHTIDLQIATQGDFLPDSAHIERWVGAAIRDERESAEVSVRIVDAEEGRTLNRQYRDKDKPTNVLSFPAELPPELELPLLGDLVVCAPVVEAEAADQQKSLESHWAHMIIHGTLHLLGYDHIETDDAEAMEALETSIMQKLNYSAPYELTHNKSGNTHSPRSYSSP